jgi:hypothetical protein
MPDELGQRPNDTSSRGFVASLLLEIIRDPKKRRKVFIGLVFVIGVYLMLTQGSVETETVRFVGWSIQGYGYYTHGTYDVRTDLSLSHEPEFSLYHHSLGNWSPLDKFGDTDVDGWYLITYQKTLLGNRLISVELMESG